MTVSEILQLSAAGFSKAEILAMSKADGGEPEETEKPKETAKHEERKDRYENFAEALAQINKRLDDLTEKKSEPEKKDTDVLALLQSMNMSGQRYDLPPQYDPEKALAGALDVVMNGAKKGDNV